MEIAQRDRDGILTIREIRPYSETQLERLRRYTCQPHDKKGRRKIRRRLEATILAGGELGEWATILQRKFSSLPVGRITNGNI